MFKNRFLIVVGVLSLFLVAMAVSLPLSGVTASEAANSAIQSGREAEAARWMAMGEYYQNQAEVKASTVDSATRSYTAQAKAVTCGVDATYGLNLDSATGSYIAWAKSLDAGNLCQ